ncbi:MAG: hypothetical protein IPM82_21280 [Saprospiraceae bacterium]|nr:hypothetical protein [Saprospiraceae bacterium]
MIFSDRTHNLNGTTFSGTGTVRQTSGILSLLSNISTNSFTLLAGTISGNYNLTVNGDLTTNGTISNIGNLTVTGAMIWNGGYLGVNASTTGTVTVGGLITIQNNPHYLYKKILTANGGVNHTGNVLEIEENGILNIPSGQTFLANSTDGNGIFGSGGIINMMGTFQRTVAGNYFLGGNITFISAVP